MKQAKRLDTIIVKTFTGSIENNIGPCLVNTRYSNGLQKVAKIVSYFSVTIESMLKAKDRNGFQA